jgi:hypothetical protein
MSMTPEEHDAWTENFFNTQTETLKAAVIERNRLWARVRALEKEMAEQPATAWVLQERITQLEQLLATERAACR